MNGRPLGFPGACDTHMHFYSSAHPTSPQATLFPPDATLADYRTLQDELGLERVVVRALVPVVDLGQLTSMR